MEQPLFVLVGLVLVLLCTGGTTSDICSDKICPQYKVTETNKDFEVRLYEATTWITTALEGKGIEALKAAHSALDNYCKRLRDKGDEIPSNAWPVLITSTEGSGLSLSWFIPPGTRITEISDPSVKQQSRAAGTVYVKAFDGTPSIEDVKIKRDNVCAALDKAKKAYNPHSFSGAFYESYISISHHNEVWISAAP